MQLMWMVVCNDISPALQSRLNQGTSGGGDTGMAIEDALKLLSVQRGLHIEILYFTQECNGSGSSCI
uniref:Uncharacterized protein n=1 Tax=Anguilla anguilla TaxID=7936 RepID=A0A0E9RDM8_ANGAN